MSGAYPELTDNAAYIQKVILNEEERFSEDPWTTTGLLSEEIQRLNESGGRDHLR
jgi:alanyl-tRNA synthetase